MTTLVLAGVELVTASTVLDRWGDVDASRLRDWVRTNRVHPITVAELAQLADIPIRRGLDPFAPARFPGKQGPENLYRWADLVQAEMDTRLSGRGNQRAG